MLKLRYFTTVIALAVATAWAEVKLPSIFSSHMVLQQGQSIPVWGWAEAGEQVTVSFAGQTVQTTADKAGLWRLELKALTASAQPAVLTVKGSNTITIDDVLVGEVWFCSGQSNMEWSMSRIANAKDEIPKADNPLIRHFKADKKASALPLDNVPSQWVLTTPATIPGHSAVAYMFGRRLHQALNVPVGLINSSWGGTRIEPWTPASGFEGIPALADIKKMVDTANPTTELHKKTLNAYLIELDNWKAAATLSSQEGRVLPPPPAFPPHLILPSGHQQPTVLYNAMVAGLVPYAIKGAIWYQGESNRGEGMLYLEKTKALVEGWRKEWGLPNLPYYMVQLAPYKYGGSETALPEIWEAQSAAAKVIPHVGYTVINDIATLGDIHPPNKQDVGLRLANQALNRTYNQKEIEWSGPTYKGYQIQGAKIRVAFDFAGGLKTRDGKAPDWFEISGADCNFVKADAVIDGETVVISSPEVTSPTALRFAWHQLAEPNLVNHLGLPTGAFRDGKTMELDDAKTLKELAGFKPLYEIDLATSPGFAAKPPVYTIDNSKTIGEFKQVAYLLQLQDKSGAIQYVMTAMDAFTPNPIELAIPRLSAKTRLQTKVANLTVRSNVKGVPALTHDNGGCIEFCALNYGTPAAAGLPGGDSRKYDFDDTFSDDGGYGCLQIHSWKARTTLLAINNFNGGVLDIGIGNNTKGEHPDYTFMKNGGDYTTRRLTIFVKH
ncbi:MAG: sialate O-acetylesterase [Kiritimatiellae bacterium]|nr:sialate O-acetylesterase [Kiritimatiellia bacterium]